MSKALKVQFELNRLTKNKARYSEITVQELDEPSVGEFYISKTALADMGFATAPKRLAITVEVPT